MMMPLNPRGDTAARRHEKMFEGLTCYRNRCFSLPSAKVLSFGCSTGEELAHLREILPPDDVLFGCDVNPDAVAAADSLGLHGTRVFASTEDNLRQFAAYDIILALSVFFVNTRNTDQLREVMPFVVFWEALIEVMSHLKEGGLLILYNASYVLSDVDLAALGLVPVRGIVRHLCGDVPRYDRNGNLVLDPRWGMHGGKRRGYYSLRPGFKGDRYSVTDCAFVKRSRRMKDPVLFRRSGDYRLREFSIVDLPERNGDVDVLDAIVRHEHVETGEILHDMAIRFPGESQWCSILLDCPLFEGGESPAVDDTVMPEESVK